MSLVFSGTLVYTTVKKEVITIWEKETIYPIGALSRCLLHSDDLFWASVEKMSEELASIAKNALTDLDENKDLSKAPLYYADAINVISTFKKESKNIQPLKDLVLAMPAQNRYAQYHRRFVRIDFLETELALDEHILLNPDNLGTPEYEKHWLEFHNRQKEIGPIRCTLNIYEQWMKILQNSSDNASSVLNIVSFDWHFDYYKETFEILLTYALDLRELLSETKRRTHLLCIATGYTSENEIFTAEKCKRSLIIDSDYPRHLTYNEARDHYDSNPNSSLYSYTSISSLIAAELTIIDKFKKPFHVCEICNMPFFSSQPTAKYCHFPNFACDGLPCSVVAATLLKENDEMKQLLTKNRNSYGTWVRRCNKGDKAPVYIKNLKRYVVGTPKNTREKKEVERIWREILADIQRTYNRWSECASKAVLDYKTGKISREECLRLISIPSDYSARGELLGKYDAEMKGEC